jgi:hypothetical protein
LVSPVPLLGTAIAKEAIGKEGREVKEGKEYSPIRINLSFRSLPPSSLLTGEA